MEKRKIRTNNTSDSAIFSWPLIAVVFIVSKICCSVRVNCSAADVEGPPPVPFLYLFKWLFFIFVLEQRSCQVCYETIYLLYKGLSK